MPTNDEDAVRRALAMLRNRGVAVTIDESEFGSAMRSFTEITKFLVGGIGVAYFYLFIVEETVQTAGFGVFTLMQGKLWREARVQNLRYREMAKAGQAMTEIFSLKQDTKVSENYIAGALHLLKLPLDFVQNLIKEITGAEQTPTEFVFLPFTLFFEAALATADSYDARIASQISDINPGYKEKVDDIKKTFALEKFKVKLAFDERMDALAVEKRQRLDELSIEVKVELQKVAAAQRTKEITRAEADKSKILIAQEKDKIEIALKQEFDEKDRALKEVHFSELSLLERVEENRLADAREKQFGTGTPPAALIPPPTTRPPETLQGQVIKIVDGDTFDVPNWRIRLVGINAAESGTQQGTLDKNKLELLIAQKIVTIKIDPDHQFDRFGRILGVVFFENINVNVEMLRSCNAALDLREENKYVDVVVFRAAAQECLLRTIPQQPPAEAPPTPQPTPPAEVQKFTITVNIVNLKGEVIPIDDADVNIGGTSLRTQSYPAGTTTTIRIRTFGVWYIAPDIVQDIQFQATLDKNLVFDFVVDTKDNLLAVIPQPKQTLPADSINFTGMIFSSEIGKLDPPWQIGRTDFVTQAHILPKREFTLGELTVGDFEIIGIRLNFDNPFSNSSALVVDMELIKPDGTTTPTPEVPTVNAGQWGWAKFAAVFAGPPREINQKGIYAIRVFTNSNDVFNGEARYYFMVN